MECTNWESPRISISGLDRAAESAVESKRFRSDVALAETEAVAVTPRSLLEIALSLMALLAK